MWNTFDSIVNIRLINKETCHYVHISVWERWVSEKYLIFIYLTKLEYRTSLKSLRTFTMIRDTWPCVGVPIPASQIYTSPCHFPEHSLFLYSLFLLSRYKLIWTISYSNRALTIIHHDAPNSHFPGISVLELLVHALSITSYHSW